MKILYAGPGEVLRCGTCSALVDEQTCPDGELDFYWCNSCTDFVSVWLDEKVNSLEAL